MSEQAKASLVPQHTPADHTVSEKVPKLQVMPDAVLQPVLSNLSIMSLELRASLLMAQGKLDEAKDLFQKAAQQQKALGYHEPPNYIRPVGETAGVAMLGARDWADAKAAYERALLERPRSGFALYSLAVAAEKSGDTDAALKAYRAFLAAWKNADPDSAQLAHAQSILLNAEAGATRSSGSGKDR